MTKQGKVAIGILIAVILGVLLFTKAPSKKARPMKAPDPAAMLQNKDKQGGGGGQAAKKRQNKKNQKKVAQKKAAALKAPEAQAAEIDFSDYEMIREKFGRDDPFAPFYDISEYTGDMFDLPDLEPLPPMIIESPRSMRLSAIGMKDGEGTAVVNGEILKVGDSILGFKVHSITPDRVELINDLKDKAILRIKPEPVNGFDVSGSSISNVLEEPDSRGSMKLIPRTAAEITLPPPGPETFREAPPPPKKKIESRLEVDNHDPAGHVLDQIDGMLSEPDNIQIK